jgi:NADH-quinone oxidoreductase subunit J
MVFLVNKNFYLFVVLISIYIFFFLDNIIYSIIGFLTIILSVCILFIILNIEFMAFILLIVYFGAIAILFLFIIMLVPIKLNSKKLVYLELNLFIFFLLFKFILVDYSHLCTYFFSIKSSLFIPDMLCINSGGIYNLFFFKPGFYCSSEVLRIGVLLYTEYFLYLQLIGIILLFSILSVLLLIIKYKKFSFTRVR